MGLDEVMINWDGYCGAQSQGDDKTSNGNGKGSLRISLGDTDVQLDGDEEEVKNDTDGTREREKVDGTWWKNRIGKVGNTPHDSRTKKHATDNFSNDPGLTDSTK